MVNAIEIEPEEILEEDNVEIVKVSDEITSPFMELCEADLPAVFEAFIFASQEPLTLKSLQTSLEEQGYEFTKNQIKDALDVTMAKWQDESRSNGQGLELVQVAGGYVFRTDPKWGSVVRALLKEKPQKMSPSQLEVLSMVAYRQPVTRIEIEEIRGVDSSSAMRRLLNLRLIKILGKSEGLGRPLLYGTTKYFLEL
ncbi:MAG: SMC-Scp complex subunit ScpB, partial [bacterium]|nr:SMC-Scp complex subunit ScpB [bacterium]